MITASEIREIFDYEPETGHFKWRVGCKWKRYFVGDIAGCPNGKGAIKITINRRGYYAHRLAWLYVHGRWPLQQIDHINCDGSDNRIANLREADAHQNSGNKRGYGVLGVKGVAPAASGSRFVARLQRSGRLYHLGTFDTASEASDAYASAAKAYFGEFARS